MTPRETLLRRFLEGHPGDAARLLEQLPAADAAATLEAVRPTDAAAVLLHMDPTEAAFCLSLLDAAAAGRVLDELPLDVAAALLRRLDASAREAALARAAPEAVAALGRLLLYPEGTAGAVMDPRVLALPSDLSVGEALERVRRSPRYTLYYVYIVDRRQKLVGVMNLREMMLADPAEKLSAQMTTGLESVGGHADQAHVLDHPGWRRLHALPVVDRDEIFLGAIRYETLRRLEEEDGGPEAGQALQTVVSLGELCWIGMAGMLAGLATTVTPASSRSGNTR